jgi:F420-dependent oxidoreductase-like protein
MQGRRCAGQIASPVGSPRLVGADERKGTLSMAESPARHLRFGIQVQAQRTSWPDFLAAVRTVEACGFDAVWNFDHMLPFAGPADGACFETIATLAAMATATTRIRLGSLVNGVLYRDPATLAKSAATIDHISGGRLEFALGAAWAEREFHAYGLPFPPVKERMDRLEEALQIVEALWSHPRTTFQGQYYTINDAPCEPKPLQQPRPPILIGGTGRRTLRIAARHADIWNGVASPEECATCIAQLQEHCRALGRDIAEIELSAHPTLAVGRTHEEAEAKARRAAEALQRNLDDERARWVLGTPDEIVEGLQRYRDVGITYWILAVGAPFDQEGLERGAAAPAPSVATQGQCRLREPWFDSYLSGTPACGGCAGEIFFQLKAVWAEQQTTWARAAVGRRRCGRPA